MRHKPIVENYQPVFEKECSMGDGLIDKKVGQKIKAMANFEVIAKYKSYCILGINSFFLSPSRREF